MESIFSQKNQLWQKVLENDMQALEQIYRSYYSDLYHYSLKITESTTLAEDAIHDTFLYLWHHRKQIGVIEALKFYLIRSVRNSCLKLIKERNKKSSLEEINEGLNLIIQPEELKLQDSSKQTKLKIQKALEDLSPRQREIIYLKFYSNLDYEEIGEVLDINYQSVVNHVHRAIIKLRNSSILQYLKFN